MPPDCVFDLLQNVRQRQMLMKLLKRSARTALPFGTKFLSCAEKQFCKFVQTDVSLF